MSSPFSASAESVSDSGHSSPDSSNVDSPLISFDRPLDESDVLSQFLKSTPTVPRPHAYVDSSTDDAVSSSAPSSSHDSPTADWPALDPAQAKASADPLWQPPDLSLFSLDGFNPSATMDFSMGLDSMLFPADPLFSMNSINTDGLSTAPAGFSLPFTFGIDAAGNLDDAIAGTSDRRSSITSSSSGQSFCPSAEHISAPQSASGTSPPLLNHPTAPSSNDQLMNELAAQARQLVGLTVALPFGPNAAPHLGDRQRQDQRGHQEQQSTRDLHPISVLNKPTPLVTNTPASALSNESTSPSPASTPAPTVTRTKTSHTTIERRYRTNLNARIQSLRAAVPALRVLEVKQGNRVGNLALKAGTRRVGVDPDAQPGQEDVIDERGYIDGVKVARKGSKANVLGKAVEYIYVLKRREMRLKREQEGLKALIRSLVGGPELVQQWERMWRDRFGGPEKDEIDTDEAEADDENDDGEDDDDVDDRESEEAGPASGRKRKRPKVDTPFSAKGKEKKVAERDIPDYSQATQPVPIMPSQPFSNSSTNMPMSVPLQPEKRKRGRPRKIPLPPVTAPAHMVQNTLGSAFASHLFQQQQASSVPVNGVKMEIEATPNVQGNEQSVPRSGQSSGQQYLLAAFAFFSFFNSPISYSSKSAWTTPEHAPTRATTHSGSVLGDVRSHGTWHESTPSGLVFGWRDAVQVTHLVVSILLLISVLAPWLPLLAKHIPRNLKPMFGIPMPFTEAHGVRQSGSSDEDESGAEEEKTKSMTQTELLSALSKSRNLPPAMEAEVLREAIGLRTGFLGTILSLTQQARFSSRSQYGLERRMLEQKAFLRLAELVAFDSNASMMTRIQTYLYAFKFLSVFSAPVKDITTLALVVRPFWRSKSVSLWALARTRAQGKIATSPHLSSAYESYILERMSIDEAAHKLSTLGRDRNGHHAGHVDISASRWAGNFEDVSEDTGAEFTSPLAILAKQVVRDFIRTHAENIFVRSVSGDICSSDSSIDDEDALEEDVHRVVEAGRSLDTRTAVLVDAFQRVCGPASAQFATAGTAQSEFESMGVSQGSDAADTEPFALLRAIALYRSIFPASSIDGPVCSGSGGSCRAGRPDSSISASMTSMPSPPPSPSRRDAALHLALRRCLDSSAFDRKDALEDARDRVVDLLTAESSAWPKRLKYS